ncbi:MAG: RNA pseudouridine synthase [Cryomorphaceae bacterium]|nr:RNA pseudouridine synthase [Cryomorphaceae bacterium]
MSERSTIDSFFTKFTSSVDEIELPQKFTFPFFYSPHPLSMRAALQLQERLESEGLGHNFGLENDGEEGALGKMFGVLVVKNKDGELGYLSAFSGKLGGQNHHQGFVPPVFDILTEGGFFLKEEEVLNRLNREIEAIENDPQFRFAIEEYNDERLTADVELKLLNDAFKASRKIRKAERASMEGMTDLEVTEMQERHRLESLTQQFEIKAKDEYWKNRLEGFKEKVVQFSSRIEAMKNERKLRSGALQQQLFDSYYFLNSRLEEKSLADIFQKGGLDQPPAGAGECAAPKLLHFAFKNDLKPIALAEFWWGLSPSSEVRKHKQYYTACKGKCEPILTHMLEGVDMDANPMLSGPEAGIEIEVVFEDDHLAVVNKPADLLAVPGKNVEESVFTHMKNRYPNATGPLTVHRLDMATSGLMLIAKSDAAHKSLQRQFIKRIIKKRYVAVLDGEVDKTSGTIDLPLRVDLFDRPRQMVCEEHGRAAVTHWELIELKEGKSRVYFYPITGRTHQLRVHSAHPQGLNIPIIGDDLYGTKSNRLHLHAERIEFIHPLKGNRMVVQIDAPF